MVMVTTVTSFGRSGLYDWLIQRVTAAVLTVYTVFLVAYILLHPDLTYDQWRLLFSQFWMRVFSLLALISIAAHAWIGLWSVLTDYITTRLLGRWANVLRIGVQMLFGFVTVAYVVWGIEILWGV